MRTEARSFISPLLSSPLIWATHNPPIRSHDYTKNYFYLLFKSSHTFERRFGSLKALLKYPIFFLFLGTFRLSSLFQRGILPHFKSSLPLTRSPRIPYSIHALYSSTRARYYRASIAIEYSEIRFHFSLVLS
jgi:hypothetical protein